MSTWWSKLRDRARRLQRDEGRHIPDPLWDKTVRRYPFLAQDTVEDQARLRSLTGRFLAQKEFHGAAGLEVTDEIAAAIAAQACLPLVHVDAGRGNAALNRSSALSWYDDFVGVVVQPNEVIARREVVDDSGVVHRYDEVISGEAMEAGPVMVSWAAVAESGLTAAEGYNVVIHEFMHKVDMADGVADGCPPLAAGFMGTRSAAEARKVWLQAWEAAYQAFREKVIIAERFGGEPTWLDPYGAERIEEFFAVACEGYFVNRTKFAQDFADLVPLLEAFFGTSLPTDTGQEQSNP
jgi:Mlc titration factor MtfA (ptsG expression regulator)